MHEYIDFLSNNKLLSLAWIAIAFMLINSFIQSKISKIKSITNPEAVTLMNKEDAIVVDIRSAAAFKKSHILNAKNIPFEKIDKDNFLSIEKYKSKPIIMVCDSGVRSAGAANKLISAGFENVFNLSSGMNGWISASLPTTLK
ncbi:MAG: rhodanese-like domain-containing protein [Psychromonas sp.]|nr:rhodanese-like domain-containing protein [Psychromonas sp.]